MSTKPDKHLGSPFSSEKGGSARTLNPSRLSSSAQDTETHFDGVDFLLDLLSDGETHTFEDILSRQIMFNEAQLELTLIFLSRFKLVSRQRHPISIRTWKVSLEPETLNFLRQLKKLEEEE